MPLPAEYDFERPWCRQPCDSEHRWRAFVAFRDLAPPRTLRGASEALTGPDGRPFDLGTLHRWSRSDGWFDRVVAFDRHLDAIKVQVIEDVLAEDARDVANRHASIARDATEAAHSVVRDWLRRLALGERLDGWSPGDVRGMLKDMITLERLVRGEATERVEHGVGFDLSALTLDEIETMRALEAKAGVDVD